MLKLILPVVFPSWRFFSSIGPSPRIQVAFLKQHDEQSEFWQEFRQKPLRITIGQGLLRLFWNPRWNETLYINSCAERMFEEPSPMREREIMGRIVRAYTAGELGHGIEAKYIQFRICTVLREHGNIVQSVLFTSIPVSLSGNC